MYEGPVPVIRIDKIGATTASRAERPDGVRRGDVPMAGGWIQRYMKLTEFLGSVLGPDYEVVLHDLGDADKSIIAIANGHVSGRTIGAPLTSVALQSIINHSYETQDYRLNYVGVAGTKLLRSSTFFVKDEEGRLVGMLCINFDDSRYRELSDRILKLRHPDVFVETNFAYNEEAAAVQATPPSAESSESFPNSLTELTDHLLDEELRFARGEWRAAQPSRQAGAGRDPQRQGHLHDEGCRQIRCRKARLFADDDLSLSQPHERWNRGRWRGLRPALDAIRPAGCFTRKWSVRRTTSVVQHQAHHCTPLAAV